MRRPAPDGHGATGHDELAAVLDELRRGGVPALVPLQGKLAEYRTRLETIDPDSLARPEALAYWLNLYNAGALNLAADAFAHGTASVLRVPGGFSRPWATVAGEVLSLDAIEHGKVRRFGDPRIHGALVCGSASCPTLRYEPFDGNRLDQQLTDQMQAFLAGGGAVADRTDNVLLLSRVFLWYGGDFVRPHRMPSWLPGTRRAVAAALHRWLAPEVASWVEQSEPSVGLLPYDWSLACAVGSRRTTETEDH
jgi:hypothetical protein